MFCMHAYKFIFENKELKLQHFLFKKNHVVNSGFFSKSDFKIISVALPAFVKLLKKNLNSDANQHWSIHDVHL